jgi:hypothetical protein
LERRSSGSRRAKEFVKGLLVVAGVLLAFFVVIGVLGLLRDSSCGRLDALRVSHLEPRQDRPGPNSVYVKGIEPGPPPSELDAYLEAESEMLKAGCDVPGGLLPSD